MNLAIVHCIALIFITHVFSDSENDCSHRIHTRMIGGKNASRCSFDYFVRYEYAVTPTQRDFCAGSLIRLEADEVDESNLVLTAAHCVHMGINGSVHNVSNAIVWIGGTKQSLKVWDAKVKVKAIIPHPDYDEPEWLENDIALIVLDKPIKTSRTIGTIQLPSTNMIGAKAFDRCQIVGWGHTTDNRTDDDVPKVLQYGNANIRSDHFCFKYANGSFIPGTNVCTGPIDKAAGNAITCGGDSGGPLVCKSKDDDDLYLVGLTSHNANVCTKGASVFTLTSPYVDWIKQEVKKLKNKNDDQSSAVVED